MKRTEDIKKYSEMDLAGLESELNSLEKSLISDRLKARAGKLDNISSIAKQKKNIARIKTVINMKSVE